MIKLFSVLLSFIILLFLDGNGYTKSCPRGEILFNGKCIVVNGLQPDVGSSSQPSRDGNSGQWNYSTEFFPNYGRNRGFEEAIGRAPAGADRDLIPARAYMRAADIPPADVGAYGLVVMQAKSTPANRNKLLMVCSSFVAHFPKSESLPSSIRPIDRMVTIWPVDAPDAAQVKADDCGFVTDHYDLLAAEAAINDAQHQNARFDGDGPYLVGWSPSNTRGIADKLVLVVDLSNFNSQVSIDRAFLFWKNKIVQNPTAWRSGFSVEQIRLAIHDFADHYGQDMLDAVKLIGLK